MAERCIGCLPYIPTLLPYSFDAASNSNSETQNRLNHDSCIIKNVRLITCPFMPYINQ